jgi:hypothetical protein
MLQEGKVLAAQGTLRPLPERLWIGGVRSACLRTLSLIGHALYLASQNGVNEDR